MELKRLYLFVGIYGPVFYFLLLTFLGFLWHGYNPITTGMSEIGAVDSPFKGVMNYIGFSLLGVSITLFSLGYRDYLKKNIQTTIAFILLLISGAFMFLVGFFPCDAGCIDVTIVGRLHSIASTVPAILMPLGAMVSAYPLAKLWGKKWGYLSFYLGVFSMAAGPLMFIESLSSFTGLIQRIGIGLSLLWMMIVSIKIRKEMRE